MRCMVCDREAEYAETPGIVLSDGSFWWMNGRTPEETLTIACGIRKKEMTIVNIESRRQKVSCNH